jgi:hypothetical protein
MGKSKLVELVLEGEKVPRQCRRSLLDLAPGASQIPEVLKDEFELAITAETLIDGWVAPSIDRAMKSSPDLT